MVPITVLNQFSDTIVDRVYKCSVVDQGNKCRTGERVDVGEGDEGIELRVERSRGCRM